MRIAYGVFGYGRGHATRAGAVLDELVKHHDVLILAGGDACDALRPQYHVSEIPTLGYQYDENGRLSTALTLRHNAGRVLDLMTNGRSVREVAERLRAFRAEVVISDAEPWTHRAARRLGLPRIAFDHFGIMVYCRPPMDWRDRLLSRRDVALYRLLTGRPDRAIVSSFYDAPAVHPGATVIGPLLRAQVGSVQARDGDYLLAYFNKGHHQLLPHVRAALAALGRPVYVYGTGRAGVDGNLYYFPPSDRGFLDHLAGCRALVSTAGNQLVGEAMHFGKPMLVMPEDSVEQRLNAAELARLGLGRQLPLADLSAEVIRTFLAERETFRANIEHHRRDGRGQALDLIERYLRELVPAPAGPVRAPESAGP